MLLVVTFGEAFQEASCSSSVFLLANLLQSDSCDFGSRSPQSKLWSRWTSWWTLAPMPLPGSATDWRLWASPNRWVKLVTNTFYLTFKCFSSRLVGFVWGTVGFGTLEALVNKRAKFSKCEIKSTGRDRSFLKITVILQERWSWGVLQLRAGFKKSLSGYKQRACKYRWK